MPGALLPRKVRESRCPGTCWGSGAAMGRQVVQAESGAAASGKVGPEGACRLMEGYVA
jgi:hypothetical protein